MNHLHDYVKRNQNTMVTDWWTFWQKVDEVAKGLAEVHDERIERERAEAETTEHKDAGVPE